MTHVIKSDPASIAAAVADIATGKRPVSIPLAEKPAQLNDINALGYALLENALREMTPYEVGFSASMVRQQNALSAKQRSILKDVALKYLGIDIDGATAPMSASVAPSTNDNSALSALRRKAAVA